MKHTATTQQQRYERYRRIVGWAEKRYRPVRGDTSLATRKYNALVVAAWHKYPEYID